MEATVKRTKLIHKVLDVRQSRHEGDEVAYYLMIDATRGVWYWAHEVVLIGST